MAEQKITTENKDEKTTVETTGSPAALKEKTPEERHQENLEKAEQANALTPSLEGDTEGLVQDKTGQWRAEGNVSSGEAKE
jgi:hypothetical protein